MSQHPLRVRYLGRVAYRDAHALQHALFRHSSEDYLLLLEHPHVYTLGVRARPEHVLTDPHSVGAELVRADRGGDVTYHGPGQLVGYPIVSVPAEKDAVPNYVHRVESLVIDALLSLGLRDVGRLDGYPGVWVEPASERARKICAIGVRVSRGRSMHGFALNVAPQMSMFEAIVPCGIADRPVTSLAQEGIDRELGDVVDAVVDAASRFLVQPGSSSPRAIEREDASVAPLVRGANATPANERALTRRLRFAGVDPDAGAPIDQRKPAHLRIEAKMGSEYLALRKTMRTLGLVTVCEEAGCPNIYECWADGTATFMINGERCTRGCGFCLVDTRKPLAIDAGEPARVAEAVEQMHLAHAVVTAVARDDVPDGGAAAFARTIEAIRARRPATTIEVLIPDVKGDDASLRTIFDARPDVLNHNLETVLRLQRAVRPSASYARSLSVLARAKAAGLVTKSGLIVGMGERDAEVLAALRDLRAVGVDVVTIGQYLRPTKQHLPVARYLSPEGFATLERAANAMGFSHVECSPLTRSSYHARRAADATRRIPVSA